MKKDIDWSTYTIQRVPRPNEPVQDAQITRTSPSPSSNTPTAATPRT
jgi:hypothetical protein